MEQIKAEKIADQFTDTFFEQISDYLIAYNEKVNDENVNKIINEKYIYESKK